MRSRSAVQRTLESRRQEVCGYDLFVEKKLIGKDLVLKNEDTGMRRIYVSNIPGNLVGEDLIRLFSKFGKVEMAYTKIPGSINHSLPLEKTKIYGFVTFYKIEDSRKVLDMKMVKFKELQEHVEIRSFTKKSTKLNLDNFKKVKDSSGKSLEHKGQFLLKSMNFSKLLEAREAQNYHNPPSIRKKMEDCDEVMPLFDRELKRKIKKNHYSGNLIFTKEP